MGKSPTDEQVQQIMEAVFAGQKIQAIKLYRQSTNCGLKEAKDFIESLQERLWQESPEKFASKPTASGCSRSAAMVLIIPAAIYLIVRGLFG